MKIYKMTATFGKLENQTLTLEPGLNVIHAPNEWGKSTWCAFLVAMLYGIDTRERTKQGSLADKERYAPWSGSPMSGRIDLSWNGRDITIERHTKGRTVFGEFSAYETETGIRVPELTAANCGQLLLGVEKSVFTRAGFVKLTDLPVSEDEALRRRLNALVTTGDESGASDNLAQKLKELKNRCRHNKTGLLPQAEAQRAQVQGALEQLQQLASQATQIRQRQEALTRELAALENHKLTLAYREAQADIARVDAAWDAAELAQQAALEKQAECALYPSREEAQDQLLHLEQLQMDKDELDSTPLPQLPEPPQAPPVFEGLTPAQALEKAAEDTGSYNTATQNTRSPLLPVALALLVLPWAALLFAPWYVAVPFALAGAVLLALSLSKTAKAKTQAAAIQARYPGLEVSRWTPLAQEYAAEVEAFEGQKQTYEAAAADLAAKKENLEGIIGQFTNGRTISEHLRFLRQALVQQEALLRAQAAVTQAEEHARALAQVVKPVEAPAQPSALDYNAQQTQWQISQLTREQQELQIRQGQVQGQMESLGQEAPLLRQLSAINERIHRLEAVYSATVYAMETLAEASSSLQRKFAPRISQRAQALFTQLTDGRYDRLLLDADLTVQAGATDEVTLRSGLWRSDGTADQQYLALRLAVAEELTPEAPLMLDDALVRFDDTRLAQAMQILKTAAQTKQVILFTCQEREEKYL